MKVLSDFTDDHSTKACDLDDAGTSTELHYCPQCYQLVTDQNSVELTIQNCGYLYGQDIGQQAVLIYTFYHFGSGFASVKDGFTEYIIPPTGDGGSAMTCTCTYDSNDLNTAAGQKLLCGADAADVDPVVRYDQHATGITCNTIFADTTLDISGKNCNGRYCPRCFRVEPTSADVTLTIQSCSYYQGQDLSSTHVLKYEFSNTGTVYEAIIADGFSSYRLSAQPYGPSATQCQCSNNRLSCDAVTLQGQWSGDLVIRGKLSVLGTSRFGSSSLVLDYLHLGSAFPVRSFARTDFSVSVFNLAHLGPMPPPRSTACLGPGLFAVDHAYLGSTTPSKSYPQPGVLMLLYGVARSGFVSSPSVPDPSVPGLLVPAQHSS